MLSITPIAAEAVAALVSDASESAGVRIARAASPTDTGGELHLSVVEEPLPGDQEVSDARVYVDSEVAPLLDDKTLDADVSGEQIRFSLHE